MKYQIINTYIIHFLLLVLYFLPLPPKLFFSKNYYKVLGIYLKYLPYSSSLNSLYNSSSMQKHCKIASAAVPKY